MVKVSIIIASYNSEKTLKTALTSVAAQNFSDWECIVVDGKSIDSTISIIKEFEYLDSRFKHISEVDKGIYDAYNKGWKIAKGLWVYYMGSDDELLPDSLKEMMANEGNCDILYGNIKYVSAVNGRLIDGKYCNGWLDDMNSVSHQAILMKRKLIEKFGGFDLRYKYSADCDLIMKSIKFGAKSNYVDTFVAKFYSGGASGMSMDCSLESFDIRLKYWNARRAYIWFLLNVPRKWLRLKIIYLKHKIGM